MKRILALILCLSCVAGLLAGCAAKPNETIPEETTLAKNIMQKEDPSKDDTLNILMIGNSHSYYYTDELVGLATAAGIKLRVSNLYYSGCTLGMHYKWWKNGESNYQFITHDEAGKTVVENTSLEYCLQQANWDAISLQTGTADFMAKPAEQVLSETKDMRAELWDYIKTQFPLTRHYWHHSWSYQLGGEKFGVVYDEVSKQHNLDKNLATIADQICIENEVLRVPTGPAWRKVRDGGYDNMCARIGVTGDYGHDGDVGGGQYLNACVWFETITGQSCLGNTWRPDYDLSEDLIATLQQAAHDTVAEMNDTK